jgi:hypothetical protein
MQSCLRLSEGVNSFEFSSTPSTLWPTPSLTLKEKEGKEGENKRVSKVGITQTMDGVDGTQILTADCTLYMVRILDSWRLASWRTKSRFRV